MHILELFSLGYIIIIITETSWNLARTKFKEKDKWNKNIGNDYVIKTSIEYSLMQHEPFPLLLEPAFIENPKCYFRRKDVQHFRSLNPFLFSLFPPLSLSQLSPLLSTV